MPKVEVNKPRRLLNDFFKVDEVHVRYERYDGTMSEEVRRLNFERGDAVGILIHDLDLEKLILTEQFRYPAHTKGEGWITEVVAGMVEKGESPESSVRREVLEEVGYEVVDLVHINTFFVSPGGSSERIFLYFAEVRSVNKLTKGGGLLSENEDIKVVEWTASECFEALDQGRILDAKTIIALNWLRNKTL